MKPFSLVLIWLCCPALALASFQLPKGQDCATVPFRLIDNRAVYDVMVEGKGPYRFIFDTGANSILNVNLARDLGLTLEAMGATGGAGAQTQQTWRAQVKHVSFGAVTGTDARFLALDLDPIAKAIGFDRLDGLMGREVMAQFLVRYEYDASQLTLCESDRAPAQFRAGTAVPFDFGPFDMPTIKAEVDGHSGDFIIDTGDRSSLTLFGPFVDRHGLRSAYPRIVRTVTGQGVGGPIPADVVKARTLSFAGFALLGITMRMPTLKTGGFATDALAGSIGTGVMRRFNATYDSQARRIYLQPNSFFAKPNRYDRSGLWLTGGLSDGFVVSAVSADGPAARAGLREGEVIVAIDGVPAAALSLIEIRDRFMDMPAATQVSLDVMADGATRHVLLTLADQI
jgi:predicted aspartyl protease